jgi:UDP:flavonoid glycosyltransferase YjiC (YdhE family)
MKILFASTPVTGHLNPLLGVMRILMDEGHEIAFLSGETLRSRIEATGAQFHTFPHGADIDLHSTAASIRPSALVFRS